MIVALPPTFGIKSPCYDQFYERKDKYKFLNEAGAVEFLQGCGLKDCEIREFRFVQVNETK